jgi:methyltransferase (TIGR00027 family)
MFSEAVSHTALLTAAGRAVESGRPAPLFVDPHAELLAGGPGRALLEQHPAPERMVASLAVRTRLFDDLVISSVAQGTAQVLLLAAGLDTRAWRLDLPAHASWFEIDYPAVLAYKASRLEGLSPRVRRTAVSFDLSTPGLADALHAAGFDRSQRTVVLVEGLLMYLAPNDAEQLLATLASLVPEGSVLSADFPNMACLDPFGPMGEFLAWLAARGAPWRFGTDHPGKALDRTGWSMEDVVFAGHPRAWPERMPFKAGFESPPPGWPANWLVRASRKAR